MKKKKWLVPAAAAVIIIILLVISAGVMIRNGIGISVGRYLEAKNEEALLIVDQTAIQLVGQTDKDIFNRLDTGDKILVIHGVINASYPGQTGSYAVFRLAKGTAEDIPRSVVRTLTELGWLESEENTISCQ